ncbi:unnamed protein product, partial [marine sediment metagenome]
RPEFALSLHTTNACNTSTGFFRTTGSHVDIQKAYIREFIDTLNDYDNVIWEIGNEPPEGDGGCATDTVDDWISYMVDYIHTYESGLDNQHLVSVNYAGGVDYGTTLKAMNAEIISPTNTCSGCTDTGKNGGEAAYTDQVVIHDTDHTYGYTGDDETPDDVRKSIWKTFARGNHLLFMDTYDNRFDGTANRTPDLDNCEGASPPECPNTAWDEARDAMGATIMFASKFVSLEDMVPVAIGDPSDWCETEYCLRNTTDDEYLVYDPDGVSSFTVDLPSGDWLYEWYDPGDNTVDSTGNFSYGGGDRSFSPPGTIADDSVLYLRQETTTYYIDMDCPTDGDGQGPACGTGVGAAWNSFSDITGIATSDDIRLKAGTTSSGSEYMDVDWSGTDIDRAVIGCYWMDGGDPNTDCSSQFPHNLPKIHGNNNTFPTSTYGLIRLTDWDTHNYITIEYLLVADSENNPIHLDTDGTPDISHHTIVQNCVFEHNDGGIDIVHTDTIIQDNLFHNSPSEPAGAAFEFTAMFMG